MSRVFFSQTLAENNTSRASTPVAVRRSNLTNAADVLQSILSVQVAASLLLISLGPPNLPILVRLALPTQYFYTSAPQLLGAWIYYIPILAINGLLEAFVTSVSTPLDVNRQSRWVRIMLHLHMD
jgi:oligosaccharide translocation protein RFT1